MRVAFFVGHPPEASETFIVDQLRALRDHEVDLFPARSGAESGFELAGVSVVAPPPIPERGLSRLGAACVQLPRAIVRDPRRALRSLSPGDPYARSLRLLFHVGRFEPRAYDVIHAHFGPNGMRAASLRRIGLLAGPLITSFHGHDVNVVPRVLGAGVYRDLFRRGDLFTCSSDFVRRRLLQLGAPESRLARIRVGVDLERFRFRPPRPAADPVLVTVARLVEVKGLRYAIEAVAKLRAEVPGITYRIVGDGPLRPTLEGHARDLGLHDRVEFLGGRAPDEVAAILHEADIFVLPSIVGADGAEEGQGLAPLEAQACGLPVVATRTGGVPESLRDGVTGVLVEPADAGALARATTDLIGERARWGEMGLVGREFVESEFSAAAATRDLFAAYDRVAPESGRG